MSDRKFGKPRRYGFCEFTGAYFALQLSRFRLHMQLEDHETALSAERTLNSTDVGGHSLRIYLANSDPFLKGKTTTRGELLDGIESRWPDKCDNLPKAQDQSAFLQSLPSGVSIPPGASAMDTINQVLVTTSPADLIEVLAQMKVNDTHVSLCHRAKV